MRENFHKRKGLSWRRRLLVVSTSNFELRSASGVNHPDLVLAKVGKLPAKNHFDD